MKNEIAEALLSELHAHGIKASIEQGGKHPRIVFWHAGQERKLPFPKTPSDRRSGPNTVAALRRILKSK